MKHLQLLSILHKFMAEMQAKDLPAAKILLLKGKCFVHK